MANKVVKILKYSMHPNTAAAAHSTAAFFAQIQNPLKLRLFLLGNLPAAFFAGLRIVDATENVCSVSVPYKWATKNPFRSTYFACLGMAAELSTGVLAMAQVKGRRPAVSMLVTAMEAQFYKKAASRTLFTCNEGAIIKSAVAQAIESDVAQTVRVSSEGHNEKGELIAKFWFEWSFKRKQPL